jgi:hypothetical protein
MVDNTITMASVKEMSKEELVNHLREYHEITLTRFATLSEMRQAHWLAHNNAECAE